MTKWEERIALLANVKYCVAAVQPFTWRISVAQLSITGRMVSAFSDSRLNTTRVTCSCASKGGF